MDKKDYLIMQGRTYQKMLNLKALNLENLFYKFFGNGS